MQPDDDPALLKIKEDFESVLTPLDRKSIKAKA